MGPYLVFERPIVVLLLRLHLNFLLKPNGPISAGQTHTWELPLSNSPDPVFGTEFKVTLVWTDPPAQPLAQTPLINNLDLEVEVNGQTTLGNGAATADDTNTIEQVVLPTAGGTAIVRVKGTAVPQGPQKYALVVTGSLARPADVPDGGVARPPSPPRSPGNPDAVALGITVPLLIIAFGAGCCFLCRRKAGAPPAAAGGGPAGGALPAGWKELKDPASGATYYLNEADNSTTWERPAAKPIYAAAPPPPPPAAPAAAPLPAPWQAVVDPGTQRTYYYNYQTGDTSWTKPA